MDNANVLVPAVPPTAVLNGAIEGEINTTFDVDASASTGTGPLSFVFSASGQCSVDSQSGSTATILRGAVDGVCFVSVTVTNSAGNDTAMDNVDVVDSSAPPPPPPP